MATAIGGTSAATATKNDTQPASLTKGAGGAMGKDQFLQLLVAQLKNQDPSNPMDGSQMAAQLAQFSSVEQLAQINETLAAQSSTATLLAENGAMSAVGKTALASADAVDVTGGVPQQITADIPAGATSATLHVYDMNGTEVASQSLSGVKDGRQTFAVTGAAKGLTAGVYKYSVEVDGAGATMNAPTYVSGRVTGVRFSSKGPVVTIDGALVPYMNVTEIGS
jgi:flagellar basal-body rod modification protein FlgD